MSSYLPTLLVPGNLKYTGYGDNQKILDEEQPLNYIMKWFALRVPKSSVIRMQKPKTLADRVLIIRSMTGSGKTTTIPAELYHRFFMIVKKTIVITQPRRLNAETIPEKQIVPWHTREKLAENKMTSSREPLIMGKNIGYQIGGFSRAPTKGIIFMTTGILLQHIKTMSPEKFMKKYGFIMMDEIHERSIELDIFMFLLKRFLESNAENPECPFVIVTSATFDMKKYCDYFLSSVPEEIRYLSMIDVSGFTFEIKDIYQKYDSKDYVATTIETIRNIHTENQADFDNDATKKSEKTFSIKPAEGFRDILVFTYGTSPIKKIMKGLEELNQKDAFFKKFPVLPISLMRDDIEAKNEGYQNIFRPYKDLSAKRRVIIATNAAETGVTIDTLRYVVDTGLLNSAEFDPTISASFLITKPVTQSMARQRRGRIGRKSPGYFFPIYTEKTYKIMRENQLPEILRNDVTPYILNIIIDFYDKDRDSNKMKFNEFIKSRYDDVVSTDSKDSKPIDLNKIDLLDLPSVDMLRYATEKLFALGAINAQSIPTPFGFVMNKIRYLSPESIRMIFAGYAWNVPVADLITIACFTNVGRQSLLDENPRNNVFARTVADGKFSLFNLKPRKIGGAAEEYPGNKKQEKPEKQKRTTDSELLLSDEFILALVTFLFYQYKLYDTLTGEITSGVNDILHKWGESTGLKMQGFKKLIEVRDETMKSIVALGFDPFANNHLSLFECYDPIRDGKQKTKAEKRAMEENLLTYVRKIKQCIFEGYKLNIATWSKDRECYITRQSGIALKITNPIVGIYSEDERKRYNLKNPERIIYEKIHYSQGQTSPVYEPNCSFISVIDGYVCGS